MTKRIATLLLAALLWHPAHADTCQMYTGTPPTSSAIDGAMSNITCNKQGQPTVAISGGSAPTPLSVTTTTTAGTITLGGTAQTAIASNASRKAYCVQNSPTATEALTVRLNGTASATTGTILVAGAQACSSPGLIDTSAVSVFAATTAHAYTTWEAQ